jgi:hypothetical protein
MNARGHATPSHLLLTVLMLAAGLGTSLLFSQWMRELRFLDVASPPARYKAVSAPREKPKPPRRAPHRFAATP